LVGQTDDCAVCIQSPDEYHDYTPCGGKAMVAPLIKLLNNEGRVGYRIQDTCRDISSEDLLHLFECSHRGKAGFDSGTLGTGLGSIIMKEVLRQKK
jgi:signal transduction histidine kinase